MKKYKRAKLVKKVGIEVKSKYPFDVGLFINDYIKSISTLKSPKQMDIRQVRHSYANNYVLHHHYLKRKLYIARNVSYGLFCGRYCVGICMFGYPVWKEFPGLVPPLEPAECPELLRLATMEGVPKNTESYFVGYCLRSMKKDWFFETGVFPKCITSLCDNALGFDGAIYKATNFTFYREIKGRASNPGGSHGKWKKNIDEQKAKKTMYIYRYKKYDESLPKMVRVVRVEKSIFSFVE